MQTSQTIGTVIGTILGILLGGAVLTAIPLVVSSLIGKPMSRKQSWSVFAVACALVTAAAIFRSKA